GPRRWLRVRVHGPSGSRSLESVDESATQPLRPGYRARWPDVHRFIIRGFASRNGAMTPIRLVLADDHAIVLHGLKRLFEGHPDFRVVECCVDGERAIAAARDETCDVLVLDLRMPGRTGLDVLKTLAAEKRRCRTILLTAAISDDDVVEAVRLGAWGVV